MFLGNVRILSYTFCILGPKLCPSIRTSQVSNVIISLLYDQFTLFPCVKAHFLRVPGRHGHDDSLLKLFFSLFICRTAHLSFQSVYLQDYVLCFNDAYLEGNLQLQMCGCLLHHGQHSTGFCLFEAVNFITN